MTTFHIEIQTPHPDDTLAHLLDELRKYCDNHGIGLLYSFSSEERGQAMSIPNKYYKKETAS